MPGPKMGPRPADFDEAMIKSSPTYVKWSQLAPGQYLRYACREFIKGHGDDDERLMRRIMIARRNNIKDHETLKRARKYIAATVAQSANKVSNDGPQQEKYHQRGPDPPQPLVHETPTVPVQAIAAAAGSQFETTLVDPALVPMSLTPEQFPVPPPIPPQQQPAPLNQLPSESPYQPQESEQHSNEDILSQTDDQIRDEMDVPAVEATRSYKTWQHLPYGAYFVYNQRYIKGHEGHDWLLRKNIWRRMRYRRENKRLVEQLRQAPADQAAAAIAQTETYETPLKAPRISAGTQHGRSRPKPVSRAPPLRQQSVAQSARQELPRPDTSAATPPPTDSSATANISSPAKAPQPGPLSCYSDPSSRKPQDSVPSSALQAAAAAALLEASGHEAVTDTAAVEAAVAAAESFCTVVHDPILAAAAAVATISKDENTVDEDIVEQVAATTTSSLAHQFGSPSDPGQHSTHKSLTPTAACTNVPAEPHTKTTDPSLVVVHDPLHAAALAAQLAAVSGTLGDESVATL